jgi:hypothetical protein
MLFIRIRGLGNMELVLIACSIIYFGFMVWAFIDVLQNKTILTVMKAIWILAILFTPVFGMLAYLYLGRSKAHLAASGKD